MRGRFIGRVSVSALVIGLGWAVSAEAADIQGHVTDAATGKPAAGANVRLEGAALTGSSISVKAGADGSFTLHNVPNGSFTLAVKYNGLQEVLVPASAGDTAVEVSVGALPNESASAPIEEVVVLGSAMHVSPSDVPLQVVQPTSVVPEGFIKNNIVPLASVDDIVKFQPSVSSNSPNGPGLGKNEGLSIRGFQDGQYNVTFDGIPFGDGSDLHHTTSAIFIAHDLAEAEVDRGPGGASTIGNATFGGTLGFRSRDPLDTFTLNPYFTFGSFHTASFAGEVNSGDTPVGHLMVDFQHETSGGYLTNTAEQRTNVFAKDVVAIGEHTTLTLVANYNHEFQYTTQGATLESMQLYGRNYGLGDDPTTQAYYGYQPSNYYSDFEYARISTTIIPNVTIENTLYTDAFAHVYTESKDASDNDPSHNGVQYYDDDGHKTVNYPDHIPGKAADARYRSWGNILRLTLNTSAGDLKTGLWWDEQHDKRYSLATDISAGNIPVNSKYGTPYTYNFPHDLIKTVQPYAEFDWTPLESLTISPGLKFSHVTRSVIATFNKTKPPTPLVYSHSYDSLLPSIGVNYAIEDDWTAYGQIAKGFLAPPIDILEVQTINGIKPEQTWNYQVGTALRRDKWMLGADMYYISFKNYLASTEVSTPTGNQTTFINGGGAVYKGIELEAQYAVGMGISAYANYTLNSAVYKGTSTAVAETPQYTASAGILYDDQQGPYASLIGKLSGPRYGLDNDGTDANQNIIYDNQYPLHSIFTVDLAGGYNFLSADEHAFVKGWTISFKVGNVLNNRQISDFAGTQSATNDPLFWTVAGRSFFLNLSATL